MTVVPIAQLRGSRMPEQGRIRTGITNAKGWPQAIDTFRFTSVDEGAIQAIAEIYGGTPKPWNEPKANVKGQWEVITEANELRVVLPAESVTNSYELWDGPVRKRVCDGENVTMMGEVDPVPCHCAGAGEMSCSPTTRAKVILPNVRFGGVWRYQSSKSWNVFREMNTMADFIETLNANSGSAIEAIMRLEQRSSMGTNPKTGKPQKQNFNVVNFSIAHSPDELLSGAARYGGPQAVGTGQEINDLSELGQGTVDPDETLTNEEAVDQLVEVFDAEVIEPDGWADKSDIPQEILSAGIRFDKEAKLWRKT